MGGTVSIDLGKTETTAQQPSLLRRHSQKIVAAAIWIALIGAILGYMALNNLTPTQALAQLVGVLQSPYGPLLYVLLYTVRPLAFFSAVVLTLLGGALYGALWGTLWVLVGSNASATLAYLLGYVLGAGALTGAADGQAGVAQRYADRMRRNSFQAILLMRLLFVPYDLVNYLAGFLRIAYPAFILATLLGSLPGTLTFVLAGASLPIADILAGRFSVSALNPWALGASAVVFVASLVLSRLLKRREQQ
jgi:uncharacterized membrane protein YdjX (TVP38/TMEM64 family)